MVPDFIIIGGQRCGTTSLYNYLTQHPCIRAAFKKEIHFFDCNYDKGVTWYKSHFPPLYERHYAKMTRGQRLLTGDATPYYIFHPHAVRRISHMFPKIKIVVMLRNPVDRAYSHYHHHKKLIDEPLSFEEAVRSEQTRLEGEQEKILQDENYQSYSHQMYSYLARGRYEEQIRPWMEAFPKEQVLIIESESFFEDPSSIFEQTLDFLDVPKLELKTYKKYNSGSFSTMSTRTRKHLVDHFLPINKSLYEYLNINFDWDK